MNLINEAEEFDAIVAQFLERIKYYEGRCPQSAIDMTALLRALKR